MNVPGGRGSCRAVTQGARAPAEPVMYSIRYFNFDPFSEIRTAPEMPNFSRRKHGHARILAATGPNREGEAPAEPLADGQLCQNPTRYSFSKCEFVRQRLMNSSTATLSWEGEAPAEPVMRNRNSFFHALMTDTYQPA